MRYTEQGLKVYEDGDVVQIGKGKVEWTVFMSEETSPGILRIKSEAGSTRNVLEESVTLVHTVQDLTDYEGIDLEEGVLELDSDDEWESGYTEYEEVMASEPSLYSRSILHGLQFKPVFQGLKDSARGKLAKRRAKNRVAKASRKANRK